jgi:hypothetical protein
MAAMQQKLTGWQRAGSFRKHNPKQIVLSWTFEYVGA